MSLSILLLRQAVLGDRAADHPAGIGVGFEDRRPPMPADPESCAAAIPAGPAPMIATLVPVAGEPNVPGPAATSHAT